MNRTVFFVHTGPDEIARYAMFHAVGLGLDVHVISDNNKWRDCPSVTYHDIEQHRSAALEFVNVYQHISINEENYERFCFERWFIIANVAKTLGASRFYYADSDLLVYPRAFDIDLENRFECFDTAWFNFFTNVSALERFCQFLVDLYASGAAKSLAVRHSIDGQPHLSDMHCLFEYGVRNHESVAPLSTMGPFLGFDERFSNTKQVVASQLCSSIQKVTRSNQKLEISMKCSGETVTVRTLHFQGRSKPFIQAYHNISDPDHIAELADLSGWYKANGLLDNPEYAEMAAALAQELAKFHNASSSRDNILEESNNAVALPLSQISMLRGTKVTNYSSLQRLENITNNIRFRDREAIIDLLKTYQFSGIGVEVGTFNGTFANEILRKTEISRLTCVDPYVTYDAFKDSINKLDLDEIFAQANRFLSQYGDRVQFTRSFSIDTALNIPDESLDFVYIDANHQSEFVFNDLCAWYPKVRVGGLIIGNDCVDVDEGRRNAHGDVTIVHSFKDDGTPGLYGDYGVLHALNNFINVNSLGCVLIETQFVIPK